MEAQANHPKSCHSPITPSLVTAESMLASSPQSQIVGSCKDMISLTIVLTASVSFVISILEVSLIQSLEEG